MTIATNNPVTTTVYYKATRAAAWTQDDDIYVDALDFSLAPKIDTCQLRRPYGLVVKTATTTRAGTKAVVAPLDLRGQWIKVRMQWDSGDTTIGTVGVLTQYWYGYCPQQVDEVRYTADSPLSAGTDLHQGTNQYTAFGIEYYLSTTPVTGVFLDDGAGGLDRTTTPVAFNNKSTVDSPGLTSNRAAAAVSAVTAAGYDVYGISTRPGRRAWTAGQVLAHLIYAFEDDTGITVTLGGQYLTGALNDFNFAYDFDGDSYWQAIQKLISPSRGFCFDVRGNDDLEIGIYVQTTTGTVVNDHAGNPLIPANTEQVTLYMDRAASAGTATIEALETGNYDAVEVRAAPMRCEWTMAHAYDTLEAAWSATDETNYGLYDKGEMPPSDVFCSFRVPENWDGTATYDGGTVNCIVQCDPADGLAYDAVQNFIPEYLQVLDTTIDYNGGPGSGSFVYGPTVGLIGYIFDEERSEWVRLDQPMDASVPACRVRPASDGNGIIVDAPYPHFFGLNHVTPPFASGDETTEDNRPCKYDWQTLYVTVQAYTGEHRRVRRTLTGEPGEIERVKYIDIPGYDFRFRAAGTILVNTLKTVPGGTSLTEATSAWDSATSFIGDLIGQIADMAAAWYGQRRSRVQLPYRSIWLPHESGDLIQVGHMIASTDVGSGIVPTGTVISDIQYRWSGGQTVTLRTEWQDLDLPALFGGVRRGGGSQSSYGSGQRATTRQQYQAQGSGSPLGLIGSDAGSWGAGSYYYRLAGGGTTDQLSAEPLPSDRTRAFEAEGGMVARRGDSRDDNPWSYVQYGQTRLSTNGANLTVDFQGGDGAWYSKSVAISGDGTHSVYICGDVGDSYSALVAALSAAGYDFAYKVGTVTTSGGYFSGAATELSQYGMPLVVIPGDTAAVGVRNSTDDGTTTLNFKAGVFTGIS